jgi:TetR/AcrR family transcriptional regulator
MAVYADAQNAHRVLTEEVKFLRGDARLALDAAQRRVVAAFSRAVARARPGLEPALRTPLAMLLFGMINWTFTWLKPDGSLTHPALGTIVADLFFGGLPAVASPPGRAAPRPRASLSPQAD